MTGLAALLGWLRCNRAVRFSAPSALRVLLVAFACLGSFARSAAAAPLSAPALDSLQLYVDCTERCELGRAATKTTCLQSCGTASSSWNKNLDSVVNRRDYQLALLEFWDAGSLTKICYESSAVVPKGQCGAANCMATHTAAECADADADGLKAFQESLAGTSDAAAQRLCTSGSQCNGFAEQCYYEPVVDLSYCKARSVVSAFHLEKVEENASEVIVNVVFDYSPVPPTILDLYIQFDGQALTLTDSRGLSAAKKAGKGVEVRQPGDNLIRVTAIGIGDSRAIQPGPIAELVFKRKTTAAAAVAFSTDEYHRSNSVAPIQGAHQAGLLADGAWGSSVQLKSGTDATQGHVLLHYDFESDQRPLSESAATKAADICPLLRLTSGRSSLAGDCPVEPTVPAGGTSDPTYAAAKRKRDRWISQLTALQNGVTVASDSVQGVSGFGRLFDGRNDHLEFPLTFNLPSAVGGDFTENRQSFSVSFWMLPDGAASANTETILFSRNVQASELSDFALLARTTNSELLDLVWLNGSLSDAAAVRTVLATGLSSRKWTHIGLSVDATARTATVFVDGQAKTPVALAAGALARCPLIQAGSLKRMTIHEEGDFTAIQGTGPETLLFSSAGGNGLYGIEAMDTNGLGRRTVLRMLDSSAKDPDYSPVVDRLVYSSNATGDSEIWIANADGSHPQRITSGFGSTADGIFARRPRWAPDASAIVFESNARDIETLDNVEGLGYQLYLIEYDAQKNQVAIPVLSGPDKITELNYPARVATGDIAMYRLTKHTEGTSNSHTQWLAGKTGTGDLSRGELAFNTTDANGANPRPSRLRVQKTYWRGIEGDKEILPLVANPALIANRALLAARATRNAGQPVREQALLSQQLSEVVTAPEFTSSITQNGTCASGGSAWVASIRYSNPNPPSTCWDTNRSQICDLSTEDKNRDGLCNIADCNASEFESVVIGYDRTQTRPEMSATQFGSWTTTNEKRLRAVQIFGTTDAVRLEMTSPVNSTPIPNGTEVATIRFCGSVSPTLTFKKQQISQKFYLMTSVTDDVTPANNVLKVDPFTLHDARIQSITGAELAPDLSRLALAVIFDARPMLMRTKDLLGTAGSDMLTTEAVRVDGLSWGGVTRFYPCNWMGAVRNPTSKLYQAAFAGALDEVHVADYARPQAAYLSEAERGHERLQKEGRDGVGSAAGPACADDSACGASRLCVSGTCQTVSCDASATYPCARGRCQRLAVELSPVEQFACVAECASDSICQEKQCANGPCRFCDQTARTCSECKNVVEDVGGLSLSYVQGCPDRNSFACDRGTCVSKCYSFDNGESKYLCDPATEYCRAGRCMLYDWNWADVSPVSLAAAGEMSSHGIKSTAAISQLYPIQFKALGVADFAHPPEVLVQAKAPGVFNGDWFDVGRVVVDNETKAEADAKPYIVNATYPVSQLRFKTIVPPYENRVGGMGLTHGRAGEFCATGAADCRLTAQGSRSVLGYEAWIAGHVAKCTRDPGNCDSEQVKYMRSGVPAVLITEIMVKNQVQPIASWVNKICPYWTGSAADAVPVDASGNPRLLIYGDASRELSNQKRAYYDTAPASALLALDASAKGFAVLNCDYLDDTGAVATVAGLELPINANVSYNQFAEDKITETANGCKVDVGTPTMSRYEACFEWGGADVSFDPFSSEPQPYRTLTLERFRSFGWGNPGDNAP